MNAPTATGRVATLVDELTLRVIEALGAPPAEADDPCAARHVLRLQIAKVVAGYLQRAATL